MDSSKPNSFTGQWMIIIICAVVIIGAIAVVVMIRRPASVTSFKECRDAGGSLMESYPEQCSYNGKTYINEAQQADNEDYVGMTEESALDQAGELSVPARVVERDGESLPVTMDFVHGRHNFYVRDGKVYRVMVEGQDSDSPATVD